MPLATKNNAIIAKDGKLAENCGCCGGWYCYGCGEGFKYDPLAGFDCNAFGTVSINGVTSYVSYANSSDIGCFSVQNGRFYQKKSTQPLCEVWVKGENGNACVRRYVRKEYHFLRPVFGNTITRTTTAANGVSFELPVSDNDVVQTTLDVSISTESASVCASGGQFVSDEAAIIVSSEVRAQLGYFEYSGGVNQSSTINFFSGFYGETLYLLLQTCRLSVLPQDKSMWPIMFDAATLSGVKNIRIVDSLVSSDRVLTEFAISKLPASAPVVITPQLVDPACQ
jgi:hypothetical protein